MRLLRAWHGVRDRSTAGHVVGRHAHREHTERGRNEVNSIKENLISEIKFRALSKFMVGGPFVCSTANRPDLHVIRSACAHSANSSFVFRDSTAFHLFICGTLGIVFFKVTCEVAQLAEASAAAALASIANEDRGAKITFRVVKTSRGQLCQLGAVF
jgi:hypothetical protein